MRVYFEEVSTTRRKSGICPECGKRCSRTEKFYQTISPFNKTKDGVEKTREQIYVEIDKKAADWAKIPPKHAKCE